MHTAGQLTEDHARAQVLRRRERRLLERHGSAWANEAGVWGLDHSFRRGFVDSVDFAAAKLLRRREKVLRGNPIRKVSLRDIGKTIECIASASCLARVSSLSLHSSLGNQGVGPTGAAVLSQSPHLAGLESLDITHGAIGNEGLRALADSPHLARLQSLTLFDSDIDSEGAQVLAGAKHWSSLTALGLGGNELQTADIELLAGVPHLANLRTLQLWTNDLDDSAIDALARSRHWRRLTVLDLYCNKITDKGAEALAGSANLRHLQVLELGQNRLRSRGALALAESPHLGELRVLGLSACKIGSPGARALARLPDRKRLEVLDLNDNRIGNPGVRRWLGPPASRAWFGSGWAAINSTTKAPPCWQPQQAWPPWKSCRSATMRSPTRGRGNSLHLGAFAAPSNFGARRQVQNSARGWDRGWRMAPTDPPFRGRITTNSGTARRLRRRRVLRSGRARRVGTLVKSRGAENVGRTRKRRTSDETASAVRLHPRGNQPATLRALVLSTDASKVW